MTWQPIETAPKDGQVVRLRGWSDENSIKARWSNGKWKLAFPWHSIQCDIPDNMVFWKPLDTI